MKQFTCIIFFTIAIAARAQMHVSVSPAGTYTACYLDSIVYEAKITGTDTSGVIYHWQKNGADIIGQDSAMLIFPHVSGSDTGSYRCIATKWTMIDTSNTVILRMYPAMKFDTLYRYNDLACPLQCKGQFKALVSGGTPFAIYPPYIYNWHAGHSQDTLCFGICPGKHRLTVIDSLGCEISQIYYVDVLKAPKVRYTIKPSDTIYLSNPTATLEFPDTAKPYLTSWKWYMYYNVDSTVTTSNVNPVTYTYDRNGYMLTMMRFRDLNGCDTTLQDTLTIKIVNLFIPNVLTPNPPNDKLTMKEIIGYDNSGKPLTKDIDLNEVFLGNELTIFDRWGRKVCHVNNYVNSTWESGKLSDGTYYYVFKGHGLYSDDMYHGSITIFK